MHRVIIVTDWLGKTIRILHPGDEPPLMAGVSYTVAFQSDDLDEVIQAAVLIKHRLRAERRPIPEAVWEELEMTAIEEGTRASPLSERGPGRAPGASWEREGESQRKGRDTSVSPRASG